MLIIIFCYNFAKDYDCKSFINRCNETTQTKQCTEQGI